MEKCYPIFSDSGIINSWRAQNWKENVNSGVNLVKIKLNQAKTYLNAHTPLNDSIGKTILRMETYHRYGPSYKKDKKTITYWKWDKDNGWVFSTEDWLYADILRNIEDAVDDGSFSQLPGWKYNGE